LVRCQDRGRFFLISDSLSEFSGGLTRANSNNA
jgi:hypothetical protein